ncbi:MAG: hypothetical protein R3C58_13130 [Parvularculaceae bacterium]
MHSAFGQSAKYLILAGAAALLPACASTKTASGAGKDDYREAIGVYTAADADAERGMDPIAAAAFWGTRYNTDQSDPVVAVKFSQSLRKIGSGEEATAVMQKAAAAFPNNSDVGLEYGKVLVESGRAFEAVRYLEAAAAKAPTDWRAFSAYGVALDQIGEHDAARVKYDRALAMSPGEVTVLNNKGLSYALDGNLSLARSTLREAATRAGADSRVRQNLALVLALSGEMREAERLARSDLPPLVADNNIDVYRQLMNQPAYWEEYAGAAADAPSFDDVPAAPLAPAPAAPSSKPKLEEQPAPKEEENKAGAPVALMEVAPVTNASMTEELPMEAEPVMEDETAFELKSDHE